MGKKKLETEVAEAVEAIETAKEEIEDVEEAIKAEAEKKPTKTKPTRNNELAVKILGVMETLRGNGIVEVTSTVLKDKLGTKNRAVIRRVMKGLAKTGKVVISEKRYGKRKQYVYKLP